MDAKWLYQTLEGEGGWERKKIRADNETQSRHDFVGEEKTRQESCWGVYLDMCT